MGEQLMAIMLNGSDLTVTQVVAAARHGEPVVELVARGDLNPKAPAA
jgi:hypothetical protein